jgi:hypothetical protein
MQGFILDVKGIKNEDTLVTILSPHTLVTAYRFYGARHANVHLGYQIDYDLIYSSRTTLAQLRNVLHLGYPWLFDRQRLYVWQTFMKLLKGHLQGVDEIDFFYYNLVENTAKKWDKTDPKRLLIEAYLQLLSFEGRLHTENICFLCDEEIVDDIALGRALLPAHPFCAPRRSIDQHKWRDVVTTHTTISLNDDEIGLFYGIVCEGF